ncbi:hypothetical protein JTB14_024797 [Gonioctena quinquepunctata]|nr:hypothetical protein JTB14_024797 [Gonioctena quinquepunctata]
MLKMWFKTPTKKLSSLRANKLVREVLESQSHPSEDEGNFMVSTVVVNEIKNSNVWVERTTADRKEFEEKDGVVMREGKTGNQQNYKEITRAKIVYCRKRKWDESSEK